MADEKGMHPVTRMRHAKTPVLVGALMLGLTPGAWAGPYGDSLSKCLVESTTAAQKTKLVRWMFAMMALHPDVQTASAITPEQRTAMSKDTGELFQRLLTATCIKQAREAIRYEGPATMQVSFGLLGQVAARELFTHPKVAEGLSEFTKYTDQNKLKELATPKE